MSPTLSYHPPKLKSAFRAILFLVIGYIGLSQIMLAAKQGFPVTYDARILIPGLGTYMLIAGIVLAMKDKRGLIYIKTFVVTFGIIGLFYLFSGMLSLFILAFITGVLAFFVFGIQVISNKPYLLLTQDSITLRTAAGYRWLWVKVPWAEIKELKSSTLANMSVSPYMEAKESVNLGIVFKNSQWLNQSYPKIPKFIKKLQQQTSGGTIAIDLSNLNKPDTQILLEVSQFAETKGIRTTGAKFN